MLSVILTGMISMKTNIKARRISLSFSKLNVFIVSALTSGISYDSFPYPLTLLSYRLICVLCKTYSFYSQL